MSQKGSLKSAIGWDLSGNAVTQILGLGITIVLSRILTPEEFGVIGVALVFLSLSDALLDFGLSSALIQKKKVTNALLSTIFYVNLSAALILTLLYLLFAPLIASLYDFPQLETVLYWLSILFTTKALSLVQAAVLKRAMKFKELTIRQMVGSLSGGLIGIIMSLQGYGVYSLVAQHLSTSIVNMLLLWVASDWRPTKRFSMAELKSVQDFSFFMFIDNLVSMVFNRIDVLLIGKVFSASTVGYYTRATSLKDQIGSFSSQSLNRVYFPFLSSLQDSKQEFEYQFARIFTIGVFLGFIASSGLSLFGHVIILGLFGPQWEPTIAIFSILVFTAGNFPLNSMIINAIVSSGSARAHFKQGLIRKGLRLLPLPVAIVGGIVPFTFALTILGFVMIVLNLYFLNRTTDISVRRFLHQWMICGSMSVGFLTLMHNLSIENLLAKALGFTCFVSLYIVLGIVLRDEGLTHLRTIARNSIKKLRSYD